MSKYIEELTMHVADSQVLKYAVGYEKEAEVVNKDSIEAALDMLDSLGENARRQLEIGIEMDNQDKELLVYFKSLLNYNSETGVFTWIDDKKSGKGYNRCHVKSGDIAGSLDRRGYRIININKKRYRGHRLAWFFIYGENLDRTDFIIDHINHDLDDNRIANLRKVDCSNNQKNALKRIDNSSGITGVHWCNTWNRWIAQININGKRKKLGSFTDVESAIQARKDAEIEYGYHVNHGKTKEEIK